MRAKVIVRRVLAGVGNELHRARLGAVMAAVVALVRGGQVGLTALGRAIGPRSYKHGVKRIDRLLGNSALTDELDLFYGAIARYVLRSQQQPIILLDWTRARNALCALTAAVPVAGRALVIYSVSRPLSEFAKPAVEFEFLKKLKTLLPAGSRAVLVADAGFRAPWIRRARELGFDFVTRVRGRTRVSRVGEQRWAHWKTAIGGPRRTPRALGAYRLTQARPVEVQLVTVDNRSKRARSAHIRRRNFRALRASMAHCEPWCLATSLELPPAKIVRLYALRMQIEMSFRDLKSHRFGWGFEDARSRSIPRMAVQILLAAIASLVAMLFGLAVEAAGLRKRFQANTTSSRRVLSLVRLGHAAITTGLRLPPRVPALPIAGIH
jgi:hypothetical protein